MMIRSICVAYKEFPLLTSLNHRGLNPNITYLVYTLDKTYIPNHAGNILEYVLEM